MTAFEKELKAYRRQTQKLLLVKTDASDRFLAELESAVCDYVDAENVNDMQKVTARFGTPEQIAKEFFAQTDIERVRKKLAVKKWIVTALIAALALWCAAVTVLFIQAQNDMTGTFTDEISVSEVKTP